MKIRDPELHKLRHHRQAGAHDEGRRRPQIPRDNLVPMWCPRCEEATVDEEASAVCPYCEDDTLQSYEED